MFFNARMDSYLLRIPDALEETMRRSKAYENAGASGIFVPCLTNSIEIKKVVQNTKLPINVMCMPNLLSFDELQVLGIKRISMASFVYRSMTKYLENTIQKIQENKSFSSLFVESTQAGFNFKRFGVVGELHNKVR